MNSRKFWFVKILICKKVFHNKLLSVFHWQFLITFIFSVSLKFRACYITGQRRQVQSKECYFMHTYTFVEFFCFSSKKIWFLSFSFLFLIIKLQVSNFRNRISTNQKSELVIRNCQWNCMFFSTYYKHFYLISCFHDQRSYFYSIYVIMSHKS